MIVGRRVIRVRADDSSVFINDSFSFMPELPEVETIRRDLTRHIVGKKISAVILSQTKVVRGERLVFEEMLVGHHVSDIDRIGKLLIFFINGREEKILIHLKMTGQLIYRFDAKVVAGGHSLSRQSFADLPNSHTRAEIIFLDGGRLFFNDMRMFGYLEVVSAEWLSQIRDRYGIEPGTPNYTLPAFKKIFQNRRTSIKAILLNQSLLSGVGNIYADEACFRAGIRPSRRANRMTAADFTRLFGAVFAVIKDGIEKRGTTFSNFVDGDGNSGGFLPFLRVYGRAGKPCKTCGAPIKKTVCAGRGTHYCAVCQK